MFVESEIWTVAQTDQGHAVLVRPIGADVAVPIFIGQLEAQSILIGLGDVPMPRPLTHDLFITVFDNLEVEISKIEITALKEYTFYAQLIVKIQEKEVTIDARPSDCLALASRLKCPIFVDESVINEAAISINVFSSKEDIISNLSTDRNNLEELLKKAIEEENYEEAARLRDQIKEIDETS